MLLLRPPDPDRYLPWKIRGRLANSSQPPDFGSFIFPPEIEILFADPIITKVEFIPPQPPMSRKFDRRKQIEDAAFRTLQASLRKQPWWLPRFIWRPVQALAIKIAFR